MVSRRRLFQAGTALAASQAVGRIAAAGMIQLALQTRDRDNRPSVTVEQIIFTNTTDPTHYVTRPRIAMHPQDTDVLTVHCQRILVSDSSSTTGIYCVRMQGVS